MYAIVGQAKHKCEYWHQSAHDSSDAEFCLYFALTLRAIHCRFQTIIMQSRFSRRTCSCTIVISMRSTERPDLKKVNIYHGGGHWTPWVGGPKTSEYVQLSHCTQATQLEPGSGAALGVARNIPNLIYNNLYSS